MDRGIREWLYKHYPALAAAHPSVNPLRKIL
jgi:hypothetical protein